MKLDEKYEKSFDELVDVCKKQGGQYDLFVSVSSKRLYGAGSNVVFTG